MLSTICGLIPRDRDFPERTRKLDIFRRVLDGTLYDVLPYSFHEERTAAGEYIPLRQRQPSVRYTLARIVVEDSAALLFSEGHFPTIESPDRAVRDAVAAWTRATRLNSVMMSAALRGSIGSVAILLRVLRGQAHLDVMDTLYLTPVWWDDAPDVLRSVTECYKVQGSELAAKGYSIGNLDAEYWFMRQWDQTWEHWYYPTQVGGTLPSVVDEDHSVRHGLGFVPIVWIRNLPGGTGVDGRCTFEAAIETNIEIDYQLSQAGRGLKYSSDPTLLIREPAGMDGTMIRGAANALVVSEKGDAKLLEIGGTASQAVIDYVATLRELALENVHGNRAEAHRLSAPASGRALELMNQGLVWLADNLRVSYGEAGILAIVRMMLRAHAIYKLKLDGGALAGLDQEAALTLQWPDWYPADSADRQRDAQTIIALVQEGLIAREDGRRMIAVDYNIETSVAAMQDISEVTE